MTLGVRPASSLDLGALANVFARSFEGYFVPIAASSAAISERVRHESIDLEASFVASVEGEDVGLVLVCRRGFTSRIGGMGLVPSARGLALGRALLARAVADARARGDKRLLLEVIEQNTPAIRLYERAGFSTLRRLVGHRAEPVASASECVEVDTLAVADMVRAEGEPSLPWQLAAETLAAMAPPTRAFRCGDAWAMVNVGTAIALRALVVPRSARRRGEATRLLGALSAMFPGLLVRVPAIVPEGLGCEWFEKCGFVRESLTQLEMALQIV